MQLETPDPSVHLDLSSENVARLKALEKKRKVSKNKFWLLLLFPLLSAGLYGIQLAFGLAYDFLGVAMVILLFAVLGLILVVLPSRDTVVRQYKKILLPVLIKDIGIDGDFSTSHLLKADAFLKANLYHEKYNHMERYDSIVGNYKSVRFGLYELAMQVVKSKQMFGGGQTRWGGGQTTRIATNYFYGWVLHVIVPRLSGNTFILPYRRKTAEECDDWTKATGEYFLKHYSANNILIGDTEFDTCFRIYTTDRAEAKRLLQPAFRQFLLRVYTISATAPAFSFAENRACMHQGIHHNSFDPERGQPLYPNETETLVKRLRYFCAVSLALHSAATAK